MRLGPFEITRKKSYEQLTAMIRRENAEDIANLKQVPRIQLQEYRSWVYSCTSLISDRVSTLPYSFYRISTEEELTTTSKSYKLFTKPFVHPNDYMSFRFIKAFCQIQLDLCGMAAIWKGTNVFGQVQELWPLNMNDFIKVEVTGDPFNPKVKYYFKSGTSNFIEFDISELIILNYVHPTDPYMGASPIQAQAYAVDTDANIEKYERDFFKNSARIDFALSTEEAIDQDKADEIKQRWKAKYGQNFHDVAVLDSGLKPIPLQYANRDFEFLALAQWTMEKVLAAYRVPKYKLSVDSSGGRAGDVQSDIAFNRESIQPRLSRWDEELTEGVCASYHPDLRIQHQNPIPRDRLIEVQEARIHVGIPTLTINEFRDKTHKAEAVDGGDRIFVPNSFVPLDRVDELLDAQIKASENTPDPEDDDRDDDEPQNNPDGSDDRDDNPTDDRAFDFGLDGFRKIYEITRDTVNPYIEEKLLSIEVGSIDEYDEYISEIFLKVMCGTVYHVLNCFGEKAVYEERVDMKDWISPMVDKVTGEYKNTLLKNINGKEIEWKDYVVAQLGGVPRLSKISNALSRACINYAKWLIISETEETMLWAVNNNECGHKGKLKDTVSKTYFQLGNVKYRFPNEILNFSCDCTLEKE